MEHYQAKHAGIIEEIPPCQHCWAAYGHYVDCPLINREAAERKSNGEVRKSNST